MAKQDNRVKKRTKFTENVDAIQIWQEIFHCASLCQSTRGSNIAKYHRKARKHSCVRSECPAFCTCGINPSAICSQGLLRREVEKAGDSSDFCLERTAVSVCVTAEHPDSRGQDAAPTAPLLLTVNDPLDPPDAQCDDEADGVPGAAGAVGHCGGHHGGQREDDDGSIKHLPGRRDAYVRTRHSRALTLRE